MSEEEKRMTPPHPLLGVPVVFRHGDEEVVGYIEDVDDSTVLLCAFRQSASGGQKIIQRSLSDEGRTWRRAGVEYPDAAPAPEAKSLGQVAREAYAPPETWRNIGSECAASWERIASAVIAAYEAGRKTETGTRWAVFDPDDGTWWDGGDWSADKSVRALYATRSGVEANCPVRHRIVPVPFRRRVKP